MQGLTSRSWTWSFRHPPETIWPILADTARFNEAGGLPRHEITEVPGPDGAVTFYGAAKMGPFHLRWRDLPVNWVSGQFMEHNRAFTSGPLSYVGAKLVLVPDAATGGAIGTYTIAAAPRNHAVPLRGVRSSAANQSRGRSPPPPLLPLLNAEIRFLLRPLLLHLLRLPETIDRRSLVVLREMQGRSLFGKGHLMVLLLRLDLSWELRRGLLFRRLPKLPPANLPPIR